MAASTGRVPPTGGKATRAVGSPGTCQFQRVPGARVTTSIPYRARPAYPEAGHGRRPVEKRGGRGCDFRRASGLWPSVASPLGHPRPLRSVRISTESGHPFRSNRGTRPTFSYTRDEEAFDAARA